VAAQREDSSGSGLHAGPDNPRQAVVRGQGRSRPPADYTVDCSEMEGGEHSSVELTISVKVPCQECGGRGYVETVTEGGYVARDSGNECLTCSGRGLIPEDMPLSQFRELLASDFG
jgi:DnaJ-class molecular chaperone